MAIEPSLKFGLIDAFLTGFSARIMKALLSSLSISRALTQGVDTIRHVVPYSLTVGVRIINF
ncbi:MAG: hypothetical protein HQL14_07615 [Candidatus Omnitrophica bacterium]|nr:hypothetical protein [Candidatus Omnitrophota bacterium]